MRVLIAGGIFRLSENERARLQPAPEVVLSDGLRAKGVEVSTIPLEALSPIAKSRSYDVIHVHHLSKASLVAALSPLAAPLVFTAHGLHVHSRLHRSIERVVQTRMSAGICLSEAERSSRIGRAPALAPKLFVAPNATVPLVSKAHLREWRPGKAFRLLFVGQLIPLKRVDRIVSALATHPALHLRMVFHNGQCESELREMAKTMGVCDRIEFVGQLSGDALAREYRDAHALVLPSETEALPSVVTEALTAGLPVVGSSVGGIPWQVADAGVLLPSHQDVGWADALARVMANYSELAVAALARGVELRVTLSLDEMVDKHVEIYKMVMSK